MVSYSAPVCGPKDKTIKPSGHREGGLISELTAGRQVLQQAQHPSKDSWLLSRAWWEAGSCYSLNMVCSPQRLRKESLVPRVAILADLGTLKRQD